jgi:hypothetical protein
MYTHGAIFINIDSTSSLKVVIESFVERDNDSNDNLKFKLTETNSYNENKNILFYDNLEDAYIEIQNYFSNCYS